jgi:hypothetical protein
MEYHLYDALDETGRNGIIALLLNHQCVFGGGDSYISYTTLLGHFSHGDNWRENCWD